MSDQYKPAYSNRESYSHSEAYSCAPDLPIGFYSEFDKKYRDWEKRKGLSTEKNVWQKQLRGVALRGQKAMANRAAFLEKEKQTLKKTKATKKCKTKKSAATTTSTKKKSASKKKLVKPGK